MENTFDSDSFAELLIAKNICTDQSEGTVSFRSRTRLGDEALKARGNAHLRKTYSRGFSGVHFHCCVCKEIETSILK